MIAHFISTSVFLLICTVSAAPTRRDCNTTYYYDLITECPTNSAFDGLYLSGYHAGAGLSNVSLSTTSGSPAGFLLDGYQRFNYNTTFPWGLTMSSNGDKSILQGVQITTGNGTQGFTFGQQGLVWSNSTFGGWVACTTTGPSVTYKQLFYALPDAGPFPDCEIVLIRDQMTSSGDPPTTTS
ncbi:MAG: hypothetical protein M1814_002372 [Vezdaea aestivalis]|nr:MAG: hypothetical protein M1814_002372 [Vezdaea aestivalis]